MQNAIFKIIDLVGSSDKSIEDAIQSAIEQLRKRKVPRDLITQKHADLLRLVGLRCLGPWQPLG